MAEIIAWVQQPSSDTDIFAACAASPSILSTPSRPIPNDPQLDPSCYEIRHVATTEGECNSLSKETYALIADFTGQGGVIKIHQTAQNVLGNHFIDSVGSGNQHPADKHICIIKWQHPWWLRLG
jgi:hypothetical protein